MGLTSLAIIPKSWIQRLGPGSHHIRILPFCAAFAVGVSLAHLHSMAAAMATWCATHVDLQEVKVNSALTVEKRISIADSLLLSLCFLPSCREAQDPALTRSLAAPHFWAPAQELVMQ